MQEHIETLRKMLREQEHSLAATNRQKPSPQPVPPTWEPKMWAARQAAAVDDWTHRQNKLTARIAALTEAIAALEALKNIRDYCTTLKVDLQNARMGKGCGC